MNKQTKSNEKGHSSERVIASNRKARHDYSIEETFESGLVLDGWEVKSLRASRAQLKESYIRLKGGEAWLVGAHFTPPDYAVGHETLDPTRARKLLLHRREINKLMRAHDREGYTIVPLDLHWRNSHAKISIALAKGKKSHDKRETLKQRDWDRSKQRLLKRS